MQGFVAEQQLCKWADGTFMLCNELAVKNVGVYKGFCLHDAMMFQRFCLVNPVHPNLKAEATNNSASLICKPPDLGLYNTQQACSK
jgi:hypothetical protein